MNKNNVIIVILLIALLCSTASAEELHVDGETYATIQGAIVAASTGDTIIVHDGTYTEDIEISKQLTIESENGYENCFIEPTSPIVLTENLITLKGFTITGGESYCTGIQVDSNDNEIRNNIITFFEGPGIDLSSSNGNTIIDNVISCNIDAGIYLDDSHHNKLTGNTLQYNGGYYCGIHMVSSTYNTITANTLSDHLHGIFMESCTYNAIMNNAIFNNEHGIYLQGSSINNQITSNNIHDNTGYNFVNDQIYEVEALNNFWNLDEAGEIDNKILDNDEGDYGYYGEVFFYPWSNGPNMVPELPTIIMFTIGLLAVIGVTYKRKE